MAEILGVVSAIIAVADLSYKILGYLRTVHDAGKDIHDYNREASSFAELLTSLAVHVTQSAGQAAWFESIRALQQGPLQQYQIRLEEFRKRVAPETRTLQKLTQQITWKFVKDDVRDILAKMERLKNLIAIALQKDHFKLSEAVYSIACEIKDDTAIIRATGDHHTAELAALKSEAQKHSALSLAILQDTSHIAALRTGAKSAEEAERKFQILEWLSNQDHFKDLHDNISRYKEGTGMWLLDDPKFIEWRDGTNDTLFCVGLPGAGKTVMSSMIIRHLFEASQIPSQHTAVVFLYLRYDLQDTQSSELLLRSLLWQVVNQLVKAPASIEEAYSRPLDRKYDQKHERTSLETLLQAAVECFSCVYFVVDALDEGDVYCIKNLISTIQSLKNTRIKLFTTSRFQPEVHGLFDGKPLLEIRASDTDIESYTMDRVTELPRCIQASRALQTEVIQAIIASAQGMFLLAKLHVDSLKDRRSLKAVRSTLRTLPSGSHAYKTAYDLTMKRITEQSKNDYALAQKVLTWIVYALRPLSETDLETALAVELGEKRVDPDNVVTAAELVSLCAGLVALDKESKTVRLVHYTTQEFFSLNPQHLLQNPHRALSDICISYLGIDDFMAGRYVDDENERHLSSHTHRYPFLRYAAQHWEDHCRAALPFNNDEEETQTSALELRLLRHEELMESYFRARGIWTRKYEDGKLGDHGRKTAMQYAATRGNSRIVSALLKLGLDPDGSMNETTPLFEAARRGHDAVVRLLLAAKANVHFQAKETKHTPLTIAIDGKFTWVNPVYPPQFHKDYDPGPTVALLLDAGADPGYLPGNLDNLTPLMRASESGMETVVSLLCRAGVDVNRRAGNDFVGNGGQTALHVAASHGHESVVKHLLQHNADPHIADNQNRSPAICAAQHGKWTILEMLLDIADIDLDHDIEYGDVILELACHSKSCPEALIQRLLHTYPDVVKSGGRLLIGAAEGKRETIVRMLLEAGSDPRLTDAHGNTALHFVAKLEHHNPDHASIAVTQALLAAKLGVDIRGRDGVTALMLASAAGHSQLLMLLVEKGANVLLRDDKGWSALTYAADKGHTHAVKKLVNAGAALQTDLSLIRAALNGHTDVLYALISAGADVNMAPENGTTALMCAAKQGQLETARMLIETGAAVNTQMEDGNSPLILSGNGGYKDLTTLLLNLGADASFKNKRGETALICVMKTQMRSAGREGFPKGIQDVLPMLLEAGVDVNASTNDGDTAILLATDRRYPYTNDSRLLLEAGAHPSVAERVKQIPRVSWVENQRSSRLESLLKAGADPNQCDDKGWTLLMQLSWAGNQVNKLKILLDYKATLDAVNYNRETALMLAVRRCNCVETVRELLKAGADPNHKDAEGRTPLFHLALRDYHPSTRKCRRVLKALVDAGGDLCAIPNDSDSLLTRHARLKRHWVVKLLLAAGADPQGFHRDGLNTVMLASMTGSDRGQEPVRRLLDAGVDPNPRDYHGHNALMLAAEYSVSPMTLRMLLSAGMDPHERDGDGLTLLMLVVLNQFAALKPENGLEMLSVLIGTGVGIDLRDKTGNTALMYAAEHIWPVEPLLRAGANPNLTNDLGQTALMKCFQSKKLRVKKTVRALIDAGADANMVDNAGRNALIWAASAERRFLDYSEVVEPLLWVPGIALDQADSDGDTAIVCAERASNYQIAHRIRVEMQSRENSGKTS